MAATTVKRQRPKASPPVPDEPEITRYILVLYQGIDSTSPLDKVSGELVIRLRREFDEIKEPCEQVEVDMWLESPGGDAHAAYKLALLLRGAASRIRVVIPDYAKSAATLLTLAADEIYMAPAAELGPLDAQIPREGGLISTISALDIARSVEDLVDTAFALALDRGAQVLQMTRLTRMESLSMMLDFAAKFMEPLVRQLDPTLIHWSNTLLDVSVAYAERLLQMRHQDTSPAMARLPRSLVENYPTHGFVVSREEARDRLGLPIRDWDAYPYKKEACALHRAFEDNGANDVRLTTLAALSEEAS